MRRLLRWGNLQVAKCSGACATCMNGEGLGGERGGLGAMPCYAMLCCSMLHSPVLCYAVLCHAMPIERAVVLGQSSPLSPSPPYPHLNGYSKLVGWVPAHYSRGAVIAPHPQDHEPLAHAGQEVGLVGTVRHSKGPHAAGQGAGTGEPHWRERGGWVGG
jgi:hypothetical protein